MRPPAGAGKEGAGYLENLPRILGGFRRGFTGCRGFWHYRSVGTTYPDKSCDKIEGDNHVAFAVDGFPKQTSSEVRPSALGCGRRALWKAR